MRVRVSLKPRRPRLPRIAPVLRRGRGKASELLDEATPLVDRSREAAASMSGVIDRTSRRKRRRGGAIAVLLLLIAAGVAMWLLWRRRDDEYARLVTEPDRPDLEPAPMPPPTEPIADEVPEPVQPASPSDLGHGRTPMTASIPASAVPPTMVEEIRSELEIAVAPVVETVVTEVVEATPPFTLPPPVKDVVEPDEPEHDANSERPEAIVDGVLKEVIEPEATVDDEISEDEAVVAESIDDAVATIEVFGEVATAIVEDVVVSDDAADIAAEPVEVDHPATASLQEAVDDLVSGVPVLDEAVEETPVAEIDVETIVEAMDDEVSEVESIAAPVAERLDQVLLAHESIEVPVQTEPFAEVETVRDDIEESVEVFDEIVEVVGDEATAVTGTVEAGSVEGAETSALQAIVSASEVKTEVEDPAEGEDLVEPTESTASTIPPWPGTAEAQEESTPLTASDAPSPPPPPTEAERNGPRPSSSPSRSGPPSSPSGAPFRGGSDQLPAGRSWPTLPR